MKRALALVMLLAAPASADDKVTTKFGAKITVSAPLRAYVGPEGEVVALVEINDSKEMLVLIRGVDPAIDGTTLRYLFEDLGDGTKTVYLDAKRGSKPYRRVLLDARDNRWELFQPGKPEHHFRLTYSKTESDKLTTKDVINAIHP